MTVEEILNRKYKDTVSNRILDVEIKLRPAGVIIENFTHKGSPGRCDGPAHINRKESTQDVWCNYVANKVSHRVDGPVYCDFKDNTIQFSVDGIDLCVITNGELTKYLE